MMTSTGKSTFTCGTCETDFDNREAREAHQDATGHGHRRNQAEARPVQRREVGFETSRTRPQAGAPAANQFGTFSVHYASEKQVAFIKSLLERKDLSTYKGDAEELRTQVAEGTVNKKHASSIIDALLALPELGSTATTPTTGARLATDKQMGFLRKLIGEKDFLSLGDSDRRKVTFVNNGGHPTAAGASALIEVLLVTAPAHTTEAKEIEAGVYTDGTSTFRVYLGQQSGQMLAAKVVEHDGHAEFEYAGKASRFVTSAFRKLTIEEAARFGKATGTCIVCARRLDVPESVDRGIGPVCFAKMGG